MTPILRIVLGIAVLIGAFVVKSKASPVLDGGGESGATLLLFGNEVSPTTMTLIVAVFAIAGLAMIGLGVMGVMKQRK